jgi:hypothetical protein
MLNFATDPLVSLCSGKKTRNRLPTAGFQGGTRNLAGSKAATFKSICAGAVAMSSAPLTMPASLSASRRMRCLLMPTRSCVPSRRRREPFPSFSLAPRRRSKTDTLRASRGLAGTSRFYPVRAVDSWQVADDSQGDFARSRARRALMNPRQRLPPVTSFVHNESEIEASLAALGQQSNSGLIVAPEAITTAKWEFLVALVALSPAGDLWSAPIPCQRRLDLLPSRHSRHRAACRRPHPARRKPAICRFNNRPSSSL